LINVPVALAAIVALAVLMPESRGKVASRLDGLGVVLSSVGLVGVTYGVIQAGQDGWTSARAAGPLLAGAAAIAAFVVWERRLVGHHREPLVDLGLFRSARFTWGTILATMVSFAMFGLLFAMPQYFQGVLGLDPLGSGIRLLPLIGGLVVGAALATRLQGTRPSIDPVTVAVPRLGANVVVGVGFAVMAVGLFLGASTTFTSGTGWAALWFIVCGFGLGFALPASMNAALGALSPERAGVGSGLIMACRQVGATIGVALLGNVLNSVYRSHVEVAGLPVAAAAAARQGVATGLAVARELGDVALGHSVRSAFITAIDVMLAVCGGIAVAAMVLAVVFLPRRRASIPPPSSEPVPVGVGGGD
jgi:hypothetical protein